MPVYKILSDEFAATGKIYDVVVDSHSGEAVLCNCYKYSSTGKCKHTYRAVVKHTKVFDLAVDSLVQLGILSSKKAAYEILGLLSTSYGTNNAIARFIRMAFGFSHPLAWPDGPPALIDQNPCALVASIDSDLPPS